MAMVMQSQLSERMAYEFCVCVCNSVQCTEDERLVQYVKEKEKIRKEIKVVCIVSLIRVCFWQVVRGVGGGVESGVIQVGMI
jgi:hypothetical protein